MTEIHGYCDERFASVREACEKNFTEKDDLGASCAITVEGEFVVDLWGGFKDEEKICYKSDSGPFPEYPGEAILDIRN